MSEKCEHGRDVWACLQCADDRRSLAPWSVVEDARRERDAAIERAEKAEKAWHYLVKTIDDANTNERARFERECAMHLFAENNIREDYDIKDCFSDARELADHYFGAKEVGNG